ncbi:MAG: phosphoenolpyruvate synthase [Gammaproteobacteria bacterium]|nr:MAG: phosphoenolpyruvate synthase [Gammaproteobacteria bacterium]
MGEFVIRLTDCRMGDVERVGGKNASLGEMIGNLAPLGIRVPDGFATTAAAYREFLVRDGLDDKIHSLLDRLDVDDVPALTETGTEIRQMIMDTPLPAALRNAVSAAWESLREGEEIAVAVRSSATAEDLPEASFAGQQETLLNVTGLDQVILAIHEVYASLFNDRAISYRVHQNFDHRLVALSVGVQRMMRSDLGSAGVMFTLDTESGFRDVIFITSSYGLGELVVQGAVNPDEFYVYKSGLAAGHEAILRRNIGSKATKMIYSTDPAERVVTVDVDEADQRQFSLTDQDVESLARQGAIIENHYGRPMDIEWGKDGNDGQLYILQARPETVQSRSGQVMVRFSLKEHSEIITTGRSIGQRVGTGVARVVRNVAEMNLIQTGDVLVADMTDPDWEPVMKRASAIVTNRGGRTCHAAIIARELGIPAVVGCGDATDAVHNGAEVTVSCAEGDEGYVYKGALRYEETEIQIEKLPDIPVKLTMNVANPDRAFTFAAIPNHGVGLARLEFIINRMIGVHPRAILEFDQQDPEIQDLIAEQMAGYPDPISFYVRKLIEGIATISAAFAPNPVIVRLSDFKSNEYANLIGGKRYEPVEENPMLGFRGASRYVDDDFKPCFELECRALKHVRNKMGLTNVQIMVPFIRTIGEAEQVVALLAENGLERGNDGLKIIMMCELPSNALLAAEFLEYFDGMSIGSNDMTQLTLGLDRDSAKIAALFDERDPAVKKMLELAISACRAQGKYIGICGQGPSDHPDLALWLLDQGIESMSLNPDSLLDTWLYLAKHSH